MQSQRRDVFLLFSARIIRLFSYGFLSIILALYLTESGFTELQVGLLFTFTLGGDAAISLWLSVSADRFGRRRTLIIGSILMLTAGIVFLLTRNFLILIIAAVIGVISPSGNEIGPFLSVEQAGLSQLVPNKMRTKIFAWYNLAGSFATAAGTLAAGWLAQLLQFGGLTRLASFRYVLMGYALGGLVLFLLFSALSPAIEVTGGKVNTRQFLGLYRSKKIILNLSGLFMLDSFAGGLIVQSLFAYWFHVKFGVESGILGSIFFGANLLAGVSALLAARLADRFGLINVMVFTHIPSSILLMLIPLMPNLPLAFGVLLLRFSISQMDVPTRQSYTMAVVAPDERSAASGVTAIARSVGASLSPMLAGVFLGIPALINLPFFMAGSLKITYDLLLYRSFILLKPPEEER